MMVLFIIILLLLLILSSAYSILLSDIVYAQRTGHNNLISPAAIEQVTTYYVTDIRVQLTMSTGLQGTAHWTKKDAQ